MDSKMRRFSSMILAAALAAGPAAAQVTPGSPTVGPAGGVASTTSPGNGQGTPAGGTGAIATTRVNPDGSIPAASAPTATRRHVRRVRHRARHRAAAPRSAAAPTTTDTNSAAGLNGSEAPSR